MVTQSPYLPIRFILYSGIQSKYLREKSLKGKMKEGKGQRAAPSAWGGWGVAVRRVLQQLRKCLLLSWPGWPWGQVPVHFLLPPPQIPTLVIQVLWLPRGGERGASLGCPTTSWGKGGGCQCTFFPGMRTEVAKCVPAVSTCRVGQRLGVQVS